MSIIAKFESEGDYFKIKQSTSLTPSISTVIAKPTRACNADCTYCSAPPYDNNMWTLEDFKYYFDKVEPFLIDGCCWIWHGGEPMMLGADFYIKAKKYVESKGRVINFSMQTNILLYSSKEWKSVFYDIFDCSISTSYDPDEKGRTVKGNAELYNRRFKKKIKEMLDDGFRPMVLGVFDNSSIGYADNLYEYALKMEQELGYSFNVRFNYKVPVGRNLSALSEGELLSPSVYGDKLIEIYERWLSDAPKFNITPQNQMLRKVVGTEASRCPWTYSCGGRFISIEPNGDVYNCDNFSELRDDRYRYGNLRLHSMYDILTSSAANELKTRRYSLPDDCYCCEHLNECQGGCVRDAIAYEKGIGGKFYYCEAWKKIFKRIKESFEDNSVNDMLKRLNGEYYA